MDLGLRGRNFVIVGGTTGMGFAARRATRRRRRQRRAAWHVTATAPPRRPSRLSAEHAVRAVGIGVDAAAPAMASISRWNGLPPTWVHCAA